MKGNNKIRKIVGLFIFLIMGFIIWRFFFYKPDFLYVGTLEATYVDLPARLSSPVKTVFFEEGQEIKKNDVLMQLECDELKLSAQLVRSNFSRSEKLFKSGTLSTENFDQIRNQKELMDMRLSWCEIKSPMDGTLIHKYFEPSEWVSPGTKIVTIAQLDQLWAYFYVEYPVVAQLKLNQNVRGKLQESPDKVFFGKMIRINEQAEFTPKNVQTREERSRLIYGVKIQFENNDRILKPGMNIEVDLGG